MAQGFAITKDDSADLGFARNALMAGAITLDEFRHWALSVIETSDIEDLPTWFFDLPDLKERFDLFRRADHQSNPVPFLPYDPLLERPGKSDALDGIAYLRGARGDGTVDETISRADALDALTRHPDVAQRFRALFPFVTLPDPETA